MDTAALSLLGGLIGIAIGVVIAPFITVGVIDMLERRDRKASMRKRGK